MKKSLEVRFQEAIKKAENELSLMVTFEKYGASESLMANQKVRIQKAEARVKRLHKELERKEG